MRTGGAQRCDLAILPSVFFTVSVRGPIYHETISAMDGTARQVWYRLALRATWSGLIDSHRVVDLFGISTF